MPIKSLARKSLRLAAQLIEQVCRDLVSNTEQKNDKMEKFGTIINGDQPVLVDFSAEWCGPCKMQAPILKEVAAKVKGKARILKIDVDKNPTIAQKYQIQGIPTLMVFKKGEVKFRQSGVMQAPQLVSLLEQNFD